jgi:hypothetical protein
MLFMFLSSRDPEIRNCYLGGNWSWGYQLIRLLHGNAASFGHASCLSVRRDRADVRIETVGRTPAAGIGTFGLKNSGALPSFTASTAFTSARPRLASLNRSSGADDSQRMPFSTQ